MEVACVSGFQDPEDQALPPGGYSKLPGNSYQMFLSEGRGGTTATRMARVTMGKPKRTPSNHWGTLTASLKLQQAGKESFHHIFSFHQELKLTFLKYKKQKPWGGQGANALGSPSPP